MAHTPGPWFYDWRTNSIGTPAGWVAAMSERDRKSDVPFGSKSADARLIAAAPELLEACKAVVAYMEENSSEADRYHGQMMKLLRAAVAKAEGKGH